MLVAPPLNLNPDQVLVVRKAQDAAGGWGTRRVASHHAPHDTRSNARHALDARRSAEPPRSQGRPCGEAQGRPARQAYRRRRGSTAPGVDSASPPLLARQMGGARPAHTVHTGMSRATGATRRGGRLLGRGAQSHPAPPGLRRRRSCRSSDSWSRVDRMRVCVNQPDRVRLLPAIVRPCPCRCSPAGGHVSPDPRLARDILSRAGGRHVGALSGEPAGRGQAPGVRRARVVGPQPGGEQGGPAGLPPPAVLARCLSAGGRRREDPRAPERSGARAPRGLPAPVVLAAAPGEGERQRQLGDGRSRPVRAL